MKAILQNLVSGVSGALLVLAVQYGAGGLSSAAPVSGVQDCVTARKLVIVDGEGKERISLMADLDAPDCARVRLNGSDGIRRVELAASGDVGYVSIFDADYPVVELLSCGGNTYLDVSKKTQIPTEFSRIVPGNILTMKKGEIVWAAR